MNKSAKEVVGREKFEKKLRHKCTAPKQFRFLELEMVNQIMLAYRLSKYGHKNQKRVNGERQFEHPKRTALILMDELNLYDPFMIIAALLHDIEEDSFILTWRDVEFIFGKKIKQMVKILTKEKSLPESKKDKKYFSKLQKANKSVKIIKLADRLDNIRDMKGWPPEKKLEYIEETKMVYLPLAKKIEGPIGLYLLEKLSEIIERR